MRLKAYFQKVHDQKVRRLHIDAGVLRLLFLAFFFLVGILLGRLFAKNVSGETDGQIAAYLEAYLGMGGLRGDDGFLMVLFTYFRYPVVSFLLGFASVGVLLLPVTFALQGFFLSFALCCFSSALGRDGLPLVFAAFALRCFLTLACSFYLASHALLSSWSLAQLSLGRAKGKYTASKPCGREQLSRFAVCVLILLFGSFMELLFLPRFLAWLAV